MLYPFMTLYDGTEIVHSDAKIENCIEKVKVIIEKPICGSFKHAECELPEYKWSHTENYSIDEIVKDLSAVIISLARDGGFENAS